MTWPNRNEKSIGEEYGMQTTESHILPREGWLAGTLYCAKVSIYNNVSAYLEFPCFRKRYPNRSKSYSHVSSLQGSFSQYPGAFSRGRRFQKFPEADEKVIAKKVGCGQKVFLISKHWKKVHNDSLQEELELRKHFQYKFRNNGLNKQTIEDKESGPAVKGWKVLDEIEKLKPAVPGLKTQSNIQLLHGQNWKKVKLLSKNDGRNAQSLCPRLEFHLLIVYISCLFAFYTLISRLCI